MFRNPVAIHRGEAAAVLRGLVGGTRYILVTSEGWRRRGVVDRVTSACGEPVLVIDRVQENPTLQALMSLEPLLADLRSSPGSVVALGGGSVMDTAKAVACALAPCATTALIETVAREDRKLPTGLAPWPIYCMPTTAGTGSEVTSTATLWDGETGAKYSLADERLYPRAAILDSSLPAMAPADLTLSTALDALSHAMESMWSVRHNPLSDAYATAAIDRIRRYLPLALEPIDAGPRHELQTAALMAGLAISATRTALAHSISYPLTGRFGLRHGFACSFTLPSVATFVLEHAPDRAGAIAAAFGIQEPSDLAPSLRDWMDQLGVFNAVRRVIDGSRVSELGDVLLAKGRADNSLRHATVTDAQSILRDSLCAVPRSGVGASRSTSGRVVWITGLSGAGKSTLARALTDRLHAAGRHVILLDGDELRQLFSNATGYDETARRDLAAQYGRLCRMLAAQGADVVCATMSLFHDIQRWNRTNIPRYVEVYLKAEPAVLIARDRGGIYSRAVRGEISHVAGVDLAYEEPESPDIVIDRNRDDVGVDATVAMLAAHLDSVR